MIKLICVIAGIVVLLSGCLDTWSGKQKEQKHIKQLEIDLARHLNKPPSVLMYEIGVHTLYVIDVPVKDEFGFPATQRCFVWRDAEKAASMSCGAEPKMVLGE